MAARLFNQAFAGILLGMIIAGGWQAQIAAAYNSEEHKLFADIGASQVRVPPGVKLPPGLDFRSGDPGAYMRTFSAAKILAEGFATNNESDYDKNKKQVLDNYYYHNFRQYTFNRKLWIPPASQGPSRILYVPTQVTATPSQFSFGELVSFYGDYRRTVVAAPNGGICYLSNADLPANIHFERGNGAYKAYAPHPMPAAEFLRCIASGLVPPFGSLGNAISYTAKKDEYDEGGWWGDEMMRVAAINDWHFSSNAIAWYVGLHRLALLYVNKARSNPAHWVTAIHYEASALHSLTDLFSFGHAVVNRDRTSLATIKRSGEQNSAPIAWMSNVLAMGGASRNAEGIVRLSNKLPAISDWPTTRYNTLKWKVNYIDDFASADENKFHDNFNSKGARVRNLNGDVFQIYGDFRMRDNPEQTRALVIATVRDSLQSLLNAYLLLQQGRTPDQIGSAGSSFFQALKYIPVFIEDDPDKLFPQKWTWYAKYADVLSGANKVPANWYQCVIPYIDGISGMPKAPDGAPDVKVISANVTPSSGPTGGAYTLTVEYALAGLADNERAKIEESAMLAGPENMREVVNERFVSRASGRITKSWTVSPRKVGTYTFHYGLGFKCAKKTGACYFEVKNNAAPQGAGEYWVRTGPELKPKDPNYYTCPASLSQVTARDGSLAVRQEIFHRNTKQLLGYADFSVRFTEPPEKWNFLQDYPLTVEVNQTNSSGNVNSSVLAEFTTGAYSRNRDETFRMPHNSSQDNRAGRANTQAGFNKVATRTYSYRPSFQGVRTALGKKFVIGLAVTTSGGLRNYDPSVPEFARSPGFSLEWTYVPSGGAAVAASPTPSTVPAGVISTTPAPIQPLAVNVIFPPVDEIGSGGNSLVSSGGSEPSDAGMGTPVAGSGNPGVGAPNGTPRAVPGVGRSGAGRSSNLPPAATSTKSPSGTAAPRTQPTSSASAFNKLANAPANNGAELNASLAKAPASSSQGTPPNAVSNSSSFQQAAGGDSGSSGASSVSLNPFSLPTGQALTAGNGIPSVASAFPNDATTGTSTFATPSISSAAPVNSSNSSVSPSAHDAAAVKEVEELFWEQQFAIRQLAYDFLSRRFTRYTNEQQAELENTMNREIARAKKAQAADLRAKETELQRKGYRIGSADINAVLRGSKSNLAFEQMYRDICDEADRKLAADSPGLLALERRDPRLAKQKTFEFLGELAKETKAKLFALNKQRSANERVLMNAMRKVAARHGYDFIAIAIRGEGPDLDQEILDELNR